MQTTNHCFSQKNENGTWLRALSQPFLLCVPQVTSGFENLLLGHSSWYNYAAAMRIYKHWDLRVSHGATGKMSFSSYPGTHIHISPLILTLTIPGSTSFWEKRSRSKCTVNLPHLKSNSSALACNVCTSASKISATISLAFCPKVKSEQAKSFHQ